ncbi:hypothetical protein [Catenuloplanes japonicus]|uniref:hypothetical protein n=1 Tax=Catenuloplanes japonicus TaxID=33876 RepID=UPI000526B9FD|nr:hypothetical protein [Catenuloplanes japonicus]
MRRIEILTAAIVLLSVSACGADDPEPDDAAPPAPSASAAPSAPAVPTTVTAEARTACEFAAASPKAGETIEFDDRYINDIWENAGSSGIPGLVYAGSEVHTRYTAWLQADLGDAAAKAQDELLDAVGRVRTACTEAGITTP